MPIALTASNRMEALAAALAEAVEAEQRTAPLTPVTVVVPNQAVAQYVRFQVAELLGISANLRFTFLRRFLAEALPGDPPLDVDALQLLLYARLLEVPDDEELAPLKAWLDSARPADASLSRQELRALALAEQVARLFEEYAYSRRGMLAEWRKGPTLVGTDHAETEAWQRRLWLEVFREVTPLPERLVRAQDADLSLPPVVHVFGLSYVAPAFAEVFARLGLASDLRIYAHNPCVEFWEDVRAAPDLAALVADRPLADRGAPLGGGEDPFGLAAADDTPALRLWGRPGREYVRLLDHLAGCDLRALFVDPGERALLPRLQRDILVRAPARSGGDELPDESIRFLACPSIRREVEVVADEIWRRVRGAPDADPLRFHQVAVMVTDRHRDAYLAHVEAVFGRRGGLPFNVIDRRLSARSRVPDAVERLLDLPAGEVEVGALLALLVHPALGGADPEADAARRQAWVEAAGVRFGADASALEGTYIDRDVYHWDQALRRLAVGAFLDPDPDAAPLDLSGPLLPLAVGDPVEAGRVVDLARRLLADARELARSRLPMREWGVLLGRLVSTYVRPDSTEAVADEIAIDRTLRALGELAEADREGCPVPYEVARELARRKLAGLDSQRGQHQADGVVVSSLLPMRAIPFRVVFVLGLGEGEFPARPDTDPLDLRRARRQPGDVTAAERDRYLFLETLLAARDALVLSWVARDAATGEGREPSAVISELRYILRGRMSESSLAGLTVELPVEDDPPEARYARALREDLCAFVGQREPPPLHAVQTAVAPSLLPEALRPTVAPEPPATETAELPLAAVRRFLESPLQASARFALGLFEPFAPTDQEAAEPLDVERRQRRALLLESFWAAGDAAGIEVAWRAGFERATLAGQAPVGPFAERRAAEDLRTLKAWHENVAPAGLPPRSEWKRVHMGRAEEHARVDHLLPALELEVPLGTGESRRIALYGALPPMAPDGGALLEPATTAETSERSFLGGFLALAALCAAGHPPPGREGCVMVIVPPSVPEGDPQKLLRWYRVPPPELAREWLAHLAGELLARFHDYRLPIEAVLDWKARVATDPDARVRVPRKDTSDERGPIRSPGRYPTLRGQEATDAIERRFGLWFTARAG